MSRCLAVLLAALGLALPVAAAPYEAPFRTTAAEVLPPELRSGDGWMVSDAVEADGEDHVFALDTEFGPMRATGEYMLHRRIIEVHALQVLEAETSTEEFAQAFAKAGALPLYVLKDVVTSPKETATSWGRGVWKGAKKAVTWIAGDRRQRAESEDSALQEAIGFNRAKRRWAAKLDVDPYTDNEKLQEQLDRVAWAEFAGGLGPKVVVAAVSVSGVSAVYRTSSLMNGPRRIVQSMSGGDLHRKNRELLRAQGLDPERIELFLDNEHLSPTLKTSITLSLLDLDGVSGRELVIERAIQVSDGLEGMHFTLDAAVTSGYHRSVEPVERVVPLARQLVVATSDGRLVAARYADHVLWMPRTADLARAMADQAAEDPRIGGAELWITGSASERSRDELDALGVELREGRFEPLTEAFIRTPDEAGKELVERGKRSKAGPVD